MEALRRLTEHFRPVSSHRRKPSALAQSYPVHEDPEPIEEFDLIALQSTPAEFLQEQCDVAHFELEALSSRYDAAEIQEVKELRQRQLDVQVQQLVHHVAANTDSLSAGIQTCRTIGGLLRHASGSSDAARTRLLSAVHDADASLKVAALHRRNKNLFEMLSLLMDVVYSHQKCIEIEALLQSAGGSDAGDSAGSPAALLRRSATELDTLAAHLAPRTVRHAKALEPQAARLTELQRRHDEHVMARLALVCTDFSDGAFRDLLSLHVLDIRRGAELAAKLKGTFAGLVTANDQYATGNREPCELQRFVVRDILGSYSKADISLAALFREIPRVKFRSALERIMRREFAWLRGFHLLQVAAQAELGTTEALLGAQRNGRDVVVRWRDGMPIVEVVDNSGSGNAAGADADGLPAGSASMELEVPIDDMERVPERVIDADAALLRPLVPSEPTFAESASAAQAEGDSASVVRAVDSATAAVERIALVANAAAPEVGSLESAPAVETIETPSPRGEDVLEGLGAPEARGGESMQPSNVHYSREAAERMEGDPMGAFPAAPVLNGTAGGIHGGQPVQAREGTEQAVHDLELVEEVQAADEVEEFARRGAVPSSQGPVSVPGSNTRGAGVLGGGGALESPLPPVAGASAEACSEPGIPCGAVSDGAVYANGDAHAGGGSGKPGAGDGSAGGSRTAGTARSAGSAGSAIVASPVSTVGSPVGSKEEGGPGDRLPSLLAGPRSVDEPSATPGHVSARESAGLCWSGSGTRRSDRGWPAEALAASRAGVQPSLSVGDFLRQQQRILHGDRGPCSSLFQNYVQIVDMMDRMRVEFGRQAARNILKLYESRTAVLGEDYEAVLERGLSFAAMVAAFCAERPGDVEGGVDGIGGTAEGGAGDRLPDDYLRDVVTTVCGQRLLPGYAREHRAELVTELLPVEKCERISSKRVCSVASVLADAMDADAQHAQQDPPFQFWLEADAFSPRHSHRPRGTGASGAGAALSGTLLRAGRYHGSSATEQASRPSGAVGDETESAVDSVASTARSQMTGVGSVEASTTVTTTARDVTPSSPSLDSGANQDATALSVGKGGSHRVMLQSSRHIARAWCTYARLMPVFKGTADVPILIVHAMQTLFEEFLLWTVTTFANVTPAAVVRGLTGTHMRFFRVVRRVMLASDRASGGKHYEHALAAAARDLERGEVTGVEAGAKGGVVGSLAARTDLRGVVGGNLDRLVRGTIACDALATLAQELLAIEPVLRKSFYSEGDDAMLRTLAALYERGTGRLFRTPGQAEAERVYGCLHEVEAVRQRCVEGAVIHNLSQLEAGTLSALRRTSYALTGLHNASAGSWLQALHSGLRQFVEALLCCAQSQRMSQASLTEIWMVAVMHIDKVVLRGLSECVASGSKLRGVVASMVFATKGGSEGRRDARRGLSRDGVVQLTSDVSQLVRSIAAAQPAEMGSTDPHAVMTVKHWVEGCYIDLVPAKETTAEQTKMESAWAAWAAKCHRGTREGKAQCLALFQALQKLNNVPDKTPWVREFKQEMLGGV